MPWTDLDFYKDIYLMGDTTEQIVPDISFPRFAARAEEAINRRNKAFPDDFVAPVYLQKCVCAVAELLCARQQAMTGLDTSGEQIVRSFSNQSYSESFFIPQEKLASMTQAEIDEQVRGVVKKYLWGTELHNAFVFAGGVGMSKPCCGICEHELKLGSFAYNQKICWNCFVVKIRSISKRLEEQGNTSDAECVEYMLACVARQHGYWQNGKVAT